jgi:hypothetical protein
MAIHGTIDTPPGQENQRPEVEIIPKRPDLVVDEGMFKDSSVSSFNAIVAVNQASSSVLRRFEQSLEGPESQTNPLAGKDYYDEISFRPFQNGHEIDSTAKTADRKRFNFSGKTFGFLNIWDNH